MNAFEKYVVTCALLFIPLLR